MILTELEKKELAKYTSYFDFSKDLSSKTILITGSKGIVGSGIIKWILLENANHGLNCHIIASTRDKSKVPSYVEAGDDIDSILVDAIRNWRFTI